MFELGLNRRNPISIRNEVLGGNDRRRRKMGSALVCRVSPILLVYPVSNRKSVESVKEE